MKPRALIIDQEEILADLWRETLKEVGIYSICVTNPDSVLVLLARGKYDAVIIDPGFYDRENVVNFEKGVELVRKLREQYQTIPIIILSAIPIDNMREHHFSPHGVEVDAYVRKSFDTRNLVSEVGKIVGLDRDLIKRYIEPVARKVEIFISYAKEDFSQAYAIYEILRQNQYSPWIDKEKLLPGQDWDLETEKAIANCDFFLACLSRNSISKEGYVQKELKKGLETIERKPEGTIYLIPVRLDECRVPARFEKFHWCNFFEDGAVEKMLEAVRLGCKQRGFVLGDDSDSSYSNTLK